MHPIIIDYISITIQITITEESRTNLALKVSDWDGNNCFFYAKNIQSLKAILLYHFLEWHFTFLALINGHLFSSNTSVYAKINQC